ncbi:MAG: ATP-binding protein [Dolichospermum sp. DET73]|nr:ATP-binding protein [Dolichospermum sp. DET73]
MENFPESAQSQLNQFKEYAISHPQLAQVDMLLMGAIREPAGFAHVLVYGPSGVGKTTMIRQITRRLNGTTVDQNGFREGGYRNGNGSPIPLLLVETRPPDGGVFNRADTPTPETMAGSPESKKRQTRKKKESPVVVTETTQNTQETTQDTPSSLVETAEVQTPPKKRQTRKKKDTAVVSEKMPQDIQSSEPVEVSLTTEPSTVEAVPKKNARRSVGQRKPQRDKVGE